MSTTWRPPEAFVHGVGSPVVVVPGRVAAWLADRLRLSELRARIRGIDAEVDAVLVALSVVASAWRLSATGNASATSEVPDANSGWLTTGETAKRVDRTDRAIRAAITTGRLPAERIGGRWFVRTEDAEHYRAQHN